MSKHTQTNGVHHRAPPTPPSPPPSHHVAKKLNDAKSSLKAPMPVTPPAPRKAAKPKHAPPPKWFAWFMAHQLELSLSLLLLILGGNALSRPVSILSTTYTPDPSYHLKSIFSRFLFLSFRKPGEEVLYYKGRDDAFLIAFWFILFFFLREATMRWAWEPLARRAGIRDRRSVARFAEQSWTLAYEIVFWSLGTYIMQTSPYRNFRTEHYYIGYPHDALPPLSKWYYMVQTAFWLQQIVTLHLEDRRKDHVQMLSHHAITVLLMTFSYVLNWTRVGNAVLCVMDFTDIIFPLAKLFVYTKRQKLADATFGVFIVSWIITRHVLFGMIIYSVAFELPVAVPHGYGWLPREGYFNSYWSHKGFTFLLVALQVILLIWFKMIMNVAWAVLRGKEATDTRSDDGESDEEEEEEPLIVDDAVVSSMADTVDRAVALQADPGERKKDR